MARRFLITLSLGAIALGWLMIATQTAHAQTERPKIALVLSGGGAAGVAHVGVIRELERMGIRPDFVTGTSMGAVVGGLYASGFTPDDLERAVTEVDWTRILDDASERDLIQPRRRDSRLDELSVLPDLPVGLGPEGPQISAGLVDGVKLTLILHELTFHADGIRDFDELPIPFRAVATDLLTAETVVLSEGDLSSAMRASMSIPGFFPPVKIDGRVLVDGGVTNNLPIDVAREMGADIVIASFIPPSLATEEDVQSLTGALGQSMAIFIHARSRFLISTLGADDVLLRPGVEDVGMLAFDEAPDTLIAGAAAVQAQSAALERLASARLPLTPRPEIGDTANAEISYDRIVVRYEGRLDPEIIRRRLDLPASGVVTPKQIERAARRVYGMELFENVTYRLERDNGERVLAFTAVPRNQGLLKPRLGLALSNVFGGDSDFTIAAGATLPEINRRGGRLDIDLAIGETEGGVLRFEQPLDLDLEFYIGGQASYIRRRGTLYQEVDEPLADITVDEANTGVILGWTPGNWGSITTGLRYEHQTSTLELGNIPGTNLDKVTQDELLLSFAIDYDTLDDTDLPTSGVQVGAEISYDLLGSDTVGEFQLDALAAQSFGPHTISPYIFLEGELEPDTFSPHFIGGFPRLPGFDENELVGDVVGVVGVRYYRRTDLIPFFGSEAFIGGGVAYGGAYGDWSEVADPDGSYFSATVFTGFETSFGPAMLAFGAAEQGQFSGTLTLGTRF